jgi:VWFA-related protein
MTRFARSLLLALSFALLSFPSPAMAQQPSTPQSTSPTATLHTGTKLVVVDVVVRDKSGHPLHGLTREDFALSEGGQLQTLRSFEEYAAPAAPPAAPKMPALPPGLFTDFTPVPDKGPLNVLLVDGLNTPLADQVYLRQQLLEYVQHLAPGTRIAIFGLADHLYMLQGFTDDPAVLRAALAGVKTGHESPLRKDSSTNTAALADALTDPFPAPGGASSALTTSEVQSFAAMASASGLKQSMAVTQTIEAFASLARWLANFPGRKNVIWFSGAFPLGGDYSQPPSEDSDIFLNMTNLLTRAQVSVYPVDPHGVQADSAFTADGVNPSQGAQFSQRQASFYANDAAVHATMQAFASDTGGEAIYNRNNLVQAATDAIEDGANYYTLSYTPSENKTGGEWRSIRVQLSKPENFKGVQLSYRRGYFADNLKVTAHKTGTAEVSADPNASSIESNPYSRTAMLHGAPTPQDIPFTTRVLPVSKAPEQLLAAGNQLPPNGSMKPPYRRYDVDCAAAARYFTLTQRPDGHRVGSVQVAVFAYDSRGQLLNTVSRTLTFDLTPDGYAQFQRLGLREHMEISAPAKGVIFLRIGVAEKTSGRIGAVEIASAEVDGLAPPDYAAEPSSNPAGAGKGATEGPQR